MSGLGQLAEGPIFVVGHPRSGTTWVYDILTAHAEVAGVLESWIFTPSVGLARMFGPEHWAPESIERQRRIHGRPIGLAQLVTRAELRDAVRELAERLLSRGVRGEHRFLVEKTPTPYTDLGVVSEVLPEARFLHVLRDGRDAAVSLMAAARSWNPGWSQFAGRGHLGRRRALYRAARSWATTVATTRAFGRRMGDRFGEVRYEELKAHPEQSVRRIFDFCRIPCDSRLVEEIVSATDFDRQFEAGEDRFRRRGRVGDWRERLGVIDRALFERGSRGVLVDAGYERRRLWWTGARVAPGADASRWGRA